MAILRFLAHSARYALSGGPWYHLWLAALAALALWGMGAYWLQLSDGLIVTSMRDQVSWAFYIGNFTFLVGVAAAAIIVVIPAYVYNWKPIKEVVVLGEILAISALVMCLLFVTVDLGRPERAWHLIPGVGWLNWPSSLLAWDVVVLNLYFVINLVLVSYLLYCSYQGRHYDARFVHPLVLLSIPAALSIHTVTAFIYNGLPGRPFWNASILAPRFIFSALCSGPAILLIVFMLLKKAARLDIKDEAIWKVAELMAYAMFLNLFLLGAETFREYYSNTEHTRHFTYLFFGIEGHYALVPYAWASVVCSVVAFVLFLAPRTRQHPVTLTLGCLLIYAGVYIEKGIGLVIPGFTPDTLGEIYEYFPTLTEIRVGAAIFSVGFLVYTLLTKVAVGLMTGELSRETIHAGAQPEGYSRRDLREALVDRLPGFPAEARSHFVRLLAFEKMPPPVLAEQVARHLQDFEEGHAPPANVEIAQRLAAWSRRLLNRWPEMASDDDRKLAQAAILYFVMDTDAADDALPGGLDDDEAVMRSVMTCLGLRTRSADLDPDRVGPSGAG